MKANTRYYLNACNRVYELEKKLDRGENKWGGFNNPNTRYKLEEQLKLARQREAKFEALLTEEEYIKHLEHIYAISWQEFKGEI